MASLKISEEHYQLLRIACLAVLAAHPTVVDDYRKDGLSNMRLNWDVLRAATIEGRNGMAWICSELYPYLNDSHIGSALAHIMANDGLNSNGKR